MRHKFERLEADVCGFCIIGFGRLLIPLHLPHSRRLLASWLMFSLPAKFALVALSFTPRYEGFPCEAYTQFRIAIRGSLPD